MLHDASLNDHHGLKINLQNEFTVLVCCGEISPIMLKKTDNLTCAYYIVDIADQ